MSDIIEPIRAAVAAAPGNHALRLHLAQLLLDAGRSREALDECVHVIGAAPDHAEAFALAAKAAHAAGDPKAPAYGKTAKNDGYLDMPALFLNARYDYVCEATHSRLAEPMRKYCRDLTEVTIRSGHWMAQERPLEVNAELVKWLATKVPGVWPRPN